MKKITNFILIITTILAVNGCSSNKIKFIADHPVQLPQQAKFKQKNLALVLGGGGAKGFAHVGVLEELGKAGIVPDVIIGCSAGAIIGGLYAANPNIPNLKAITLDGKRSEVIAIGFKDWPYSIYTQNNLRGYLKRNLHTDRFDQLKIPFIAVATDLQYGNLTPFSQGGLIDAIVASAAYPGAFAPVRIKHQYYVDGGVADPVPVRVAKQLGFKRVIAVNIAEQLPNTDPNHIFGVIKRSTEISYINQIKYALAGADLVIDFKFQGIGTFSDHSNYYLYEEGKKATINALPKILQLMNLSQ